MDNSVTPILGAARQAYQAGLCVLPVAADGSKRPDVPTWEGFKSIRPTREQMQAFRFEHRTGFGMIAGAASGHRGSWDFDCGETYHRFLDEAQHCGLGAVVQRIRLGYEDETPNGGRRWIVRYPETLEWKDTTLARRPANDGGSSVKTLIELTTFAVLAPSHGTTHPTG